MKSSADDTFNFFVDSKNNLCYSNLNKKGIWSRPSIIKKQIHPCFFADIDSNDKLHIISQNLNGDIFYTFINSKSIKTIQILKSKSSSSYNKHLYLIPSNDCVHFFYILHHKNSMILSHQILKNSTLSNPQIIASSSKNIYPYSVLSSDIGNIYLYYNFFDGKFFQLGYKIYSPFEAMWTKFSQITNSNSDVFLIDSLIDSSNTTHIIYKEKKSTNPPKFFYARFSPNENFSKIQINKIPESNPSLTIFQKSVIIFGIKNNIIHFIKSDDLGLSWSNIEQCSINGDFFCVGFKSNLDHGLIISNRLPISFVNGYTIASFNNVSSISPNDFKTIVLDSLNILKNKFEKLNDEISNLKITCQNLESKLNKKKSYNIDTSSLEKQNLLDTQSEYEKFVKELKASYNLDVNPNYNIHKYSGNISKLPQPNKAKKSYIKRKLQNKTFKKAPG